ncbi:MAG: cold shock domain-containing protein [Thermodesulfobacteriota bacterium]
MAERFEGKVKFFSSQGRYGFIIGPNQIEYYFRESDCQRTVTNLKDGEPVSFVLVNGLKGPRAVAIRKTSDVEESK